MKNLVKELQAKGKLSIRRNDKGYSASLRLKSTIDIVLVSKSKYLLEDAIKHLHSSMNFVLKALDESSVDYKIIDPPDTDNPC